MSSAPTQIAVAPTSAGNLVTTASGQIQKDYLEEPLARQNSLGNRGRGGLKGKALTRSHAMREAASPPRTPTPRSDHLSGLSPIASGNHSPSSTETINDINIISKMHVQSISSTQTTMDAPAVIVTQQQQQQQQIQQTQSHSNVVIYNNSSNDNNTNSGNVICNDVDFPKLTPPKSSKGARNRDNGNNNNNSNINHNNSTNNNNNVSNSGNGGVNVNNNNNVTSGADNIINKTNDHNKIQQQQHSTTTINSSITTAGDSTNYYNSKKVVNDSSNIKSPSNHNNSNGQNNNSSINSNNNNNQINSPSTNTSNRNNNNLNNDNYINNNNNSNNSSNINVSVSQLNPQASPYINNSPISPPVATSPYDNNNKDNNNRCPRNESQNSNNSGGNYSQDDNIQNCMESPNDKSDRLSKKHRNGANSKGTKPRLKNMSGSSSSMEGGNSTSGFISRDSSTEQFTDQSGIDLVQFFKETLNKSLKDRSTLMEIEKDLIELAHDKSQKELRFQPMSSYNRMLIHRVAAFFGMDHNVDKATQQCVIVAATKGTRIPDIRFEQLVRDEPRKSILKRDTHSFDDSRQGSYLGVDRGVLDRKAKSFEEREEEYEKARRRIFRGRESIEMSEEQYWHWSNNDSGSNNNGPSNNERMRQNNKLLKPMERQDSRQNISKSHSYGGYGGPPSNGPTQHQQNMPSLSRGDSVNSNKSSGQRVFSKQDSSGSSNAQSWRLSPSSSGYKTQTQSLRSESITPSPTGYGSSSDDHTSSELLIEPTTVMVSASCGVVWAVTDMASVPRGSVLINPQTLQPFVNQDGSVYHYDPSNLPPNQSAGGAPGMYNNNPNNTHRKNNKIERQKKPSEPHQQQHPQQQQQHPQQQQQQPQPNYTNNGSSSPSGLSQHVVNNSSTPIVDAVIVVAATTTTATTTTTINNNLINSNNNSTPNIDTGNGTTTTTTSIDNMSELPGQTPVNINSNSNNSCGNIIQNTVDIDENEDDDEDDDDDDEEIDDSSTKENSIMINREMDDIEEEIVSNNYEDCEKSTLKVDDECRNLQEKPKFINQATSPNIPSPEPEYNLNTTVIVPFNEIGKPNIKSSNSDNQTPINTSNVSTRSTPSTALTDNKKDETKSISSNIPIMSYATGYQTIDGATVFQPAGAGPYTTTTYQQGPDGSVYAVPQQMVYTAYPQPIDNGEIQGYFVYDQAAAARDGTTLVPTPVYQPSNGTTVVPVAAYPSTPFGSAPIYQQQLVYTPEQFPNAVAAPSATAAGQVPQYPVTYPVGYSYPYNGYWGQTMTYYVPQPPLANAVSSSIIAPPPLPIVATGATSTAQAVNIGNSITQPNNHSNSYSITTSGKRNTPPQQTQQHNHHHHHHNHSNQQQQPQHHHHHHQQQQQQSHHQSHHTQSQQQQQQQNLSGQSSQSATPANATYQFATTASAGVPVALTTDPNGPTMYAIPQSAVFPNAMLPYGHPPQTQLVPTTQATQAAPAGVITHLPPQSQTVISPMIAQSVGGGPPGSLLPPQHISIDQTGALSIQQPPHANTIVSHSIPTNGNNAGAGNHGNRSCTPQSTPSTPVSTTLPTMNHHHHPPHRNNPPLFATPPMLPNGFNSQLANNPYQPQHYTESHSHHHSSQQLQQQQYNQHSHSGASVSSTSYEKKNSYSNIKKNNGSNNSNHNNNNNGGAGGYNSNNSGNRQNVYSSNINNSNQRKMHENANSSVNNFNSNNSNSSSTNNLNTNNNSNNRQIYNTSQSNNNKRINNIEKNQSSTTIGNAGANNSVGVQNNLISGTNSNTSTTVALITSNNNINNSAQIMNSEIKPRPGGIRQKPGNLDFKRNTSQRNSPSTNSLESNNNSPNSIASSHNNNHNNNNTNPNNGISGGIPTTPVIMTAVTAATASAEHHQSHPQAHQHQPQQQHQQTMYMTRGTHIPPMHPPSAAAIAAATAAVVSDAAAAAAATHQPLIGAYNHHQVAPGGMYFKYGQTYFAHPSVATLPNNRRSPPNEIRPSLTPIYSAVNMMLPAPRQMQPRHPNPNYKGNKPSR